MAGSTSLADWIQELFRDLEARAEFQADPHRYAADRGFDGLSSADVSDALMLIADNQPDGHEYPVGGNAVHYPPSPPMHGGGADGAHYLDSYVANSYTIIEDDESIDTGSGDFDEVIDNAAVVASGHGAVAVARGIRRHGCRRRPGPGRRRLPAENGAPRRGTAVPCLAAGRRPFVVGAASHSVPKCPATEQREGDFEQDEGQDCHGGPTGPG